MARMSINSYSPRIDYGDILKLTNWILDSGATCHMTPDISDFIPGLLVETNIYRSSRWAFLHSKTNRIISKRNVWQ